MANTTVADNVPSSGGTLSSNITSTTNTPTPPLPHAPKRHAHARPQRRDAHGGDVEARWDSIHSCVGHHHPYIYQQHHGVTDPSTVEDRPALCRLSQDVSISPLLSLENTTSTPLHPPSALNQLFRRPRVGQYHNTTYRLLCNEGQRKARQEHMQIVILPLVAEWYQFS
ncbi:hypothetical protein BKA80DRAFT_258457 [Phyllosticta citrichinensis]